MGGVGTLDLAETMRCDIVLPNLRHVAQRHEALQRAHLKTDCLTSRSAMTILPNLKLLEKSMTRPGPMTTETVRMTDTYGDLRWNLLRRLTVEWTRYDDGHSSTTT